MADATASASAVRRIRRIRCVSAGLASAAGLARLDPSRRSAGKGRKDDVRGSRIYPASSPDAPVDADVRTVRDFVKHRGPESKHPKGFKRAI